VKYLDKYAGVPIYAGFDWERDRELRGMQGNQNGGTDGTGIKGEGRYVRAWRGIAARALFGLGLAGALLVLVFGASALAVAKGVNGFFGNSGAEGG
jgi:hypothetical protein